MLDCTTNTYETLYARWLEKPEALLDWGGYDVRWHQLVLDVCGGTGAVAKVARERGSEVTLVDLNPRCTDPAVKALRGRVEDLTWSAQGHLGTLARARQMAWVKWDFLVCRQALGYLDLDAAARALSSVAREGATFVCNTFVKPKWSFQRYTFQGRTYFEVSGYFGRRVWHLQATGVYFDVTTFHWYSAEEIRMAFAPYWMLEKIEETNKSLRFLFKRKGSP
jgi:ubiquinone/menaquinone biosynthesis C-methylase UbiE